MSKEQAFRNAMDSDAWWAANTFTENDPNRVCEVVRLCHREGIKFKLFVPRSIRDTTNEARSAKARLDEMRYNYDALLAKAQRILLAMDDVEATYQAHEAEVAFSRECVEDE